jgi:hypothetical protein
MAVAQVLVKTLRSVKKLAVITALALCAGTAVLSAYAYVIRSQAESLLKDLTSLRIGVSTDSDVEQVIQRHRRFVTGQHRDQSSFSTAFKIQNTWLSALRLEPQAWFDAGVIVENGRVSQISASLFRVMPIYPTFEASAGMVVEYARNSSNHVPSPHYYFPTPVGKPYLRVELDSQASALERRHAFDFSFRCLTKPGGGCDLSCDYLPSAWQDWRESLKSSGLGPEVFYEHYPKSTRCEPAH